MNLPKSRIMAGYQCLKRLQRTYESVEVSDGSRTERVWKRIARSKLAEYLIKFQIARLAFCNRDRLTVARKIEACSAEYGDLRRPSL